MEDFMGIDKSLHVGIAGTGAMAVGFAALFSGNGYKTTAIGRSEASLNKLRDAYARAFDALEERRLVNAAQRKKCEAFISYSTRFEDLSDAEIVFEAVYEDLGIKYEIYKKIEAYCPNVKAIASATSALAPADLIKGFEKYRSRLLVTHPFNPPYLIPLIELVGCDETNPETIHLVKIFLESCGRKIIVLKKSIPGFIANRLQHAMLREALYIVRQGVATAEEVDMVLSNSFIPRYTKVGIIAFNDGYGMDQLEHLQNYLYAHLCNEPGASPLVSEAAKQGNLGQKTGKGIFDWDPAKIEKFRRDALEPYWQLFNWNLP